MNGKSLTVFFTSIAIATAAMPTTATNAQTDNTVQFICSQGFDRDSGQRLPTTFAWHKQGKTALIRWKTPWGNGITPQQRCEQVSPRFQQAYDNGTLNFITNGTMNGQPVICTAKEQGGQCQTVLMTLRAEDNSLQMLNQLKDVLGGRTTGPVVHSSGASQTYYRVDIDKFLETAPVEPE